MSALTKAVPLTVKELSLPAGLPRRLGGARSRWAWGRAMQWLLGAELVLLMAMAQVMFAGYRMGVGNQTIQVPFLKHWADPQLYANDTMVHKTLGDYPSLFFRGLAKVVAVADRLIPTAADGERPMDPIITAYFWLHVLTSAAVMAAAYGLGRAMFASRGSAKVLMLLLLAGHHRALAGDEMYSIGFTHTWAVFPLAIGAMALLYRGWYGAAFALVGIIFNLHALTAGYLLVMFLAWGVMECRRPGWWWRFALWIGVFAVLASPTALEMVRNHQVWSADWLDKTRVRSGDHSFPSTWWTSGTEDIPRFALLVGLAATLFSFVLDRRTRRKTLLMLVGAGVLFVAGVLFTEIWPVPTVVRAQLFRASRLVLVLLMAVIANGIVAGWKGSGLPAAIAGLFRRREVAVEWTGSSNRPAPAPVAIPVGRAPQAERWMEISGTGRVLEFLLATAMLFFVAIPGAMPGLMWVVLGGAVVGLVNSRLSWKQAVVASAAMLAAVVAQRTIDYHIAGIDGSLRLDRFLKACVEAGWMLLLALGLALGVAMMLVVRIGPRAKLCALVAVHVGCVILAIHGYRHYAYAGVSKQDPWVMAQLWAAKNTPKDAVFLTPPQQGGWRMYSNRPVVVEWRDGTQMYFTADFAKDWWARLTSLRPTIFDARGKELSRGKALEAMSDVEIVNLAKQYGASYVVLPGDVDRKAFERVFWSRESETLREAKESWAIYRPVILSEDDKFIIETALPNIEKYRKSDAKIELVDADGKPLADADFEIRQTKQAFLFGCSIPPFDDLKDYWSPEWTAPKNTEKQLKLMAEVFNFTVIPFSAKWNILEPTQGNYHFEDLDKYVDFCVKNGITMEFHYLGGFTPRWATRDGLPEAWRKYCRVVVERYHDRIKYWQVINDARLSASAADVFKEIHAKHPDLKLGLSNCSTFWYRGYDPAATNVDLSQTQIMLGSTELDQLQAEGAHVDFFATHGHKPNGVWPDLKVIYTAFDAFAKYGVKLQVSEATLDIGVPMLGPWAKDGEKWDEERAAEFFEKYYTIVFSHPAAEALNYWDLGDSIVRTGGGGFGRGGGGMMMGGTGQAGLLDPKKEYEPRPLYNKLKELIRERWMTKFSGKSAGDGTVGFRGFHGDYEVIVKQGDKTLKGTFSVKAEGGNPVKVVVGP